MTKNEAAVLVIRESEHRAIYGFPPLPPLFSPRRLDHTGKCEGCGEHEIIRYGYCGECLLPELNKLSVS